jgi:hypothetical protein
LILTAFAHFVAGFHGWLADDETSRQLRAINQMIAASPTLLAHEQQIFARFTASLADLLSPSDAPAGSRLGERDCVPIRIGDVHGRTPFEYVSIGSCSLPSETGTPAKRWAIALISGRLV